MSVTQVRRGCESATSKRSALARSGANISMSVPVIQACAPSARISSNSAARRPASRWAAISSSSSSGACPSRALEQAPRRPPARWRSAAPSARRSSIRAHRRASACGARRDRSGAGRRWCGRPRRRGCARAPGARATSRPRHRHARTATGRSRRRATAAPPGRRPPRRAGASAQLRRAHRLRAAARHRDAGFRHLVFQPVQPGRIARAEFQQPRAFAHRGLIAGGARAWPASKPSTSRSRNLRRPLALSMNSRSIAGVSQIICTSSPRSAELCAGAPFRRTWRRSPPSRPQRQAGADFIESRRRARHSPPRPTARRWARRSVPCGYVRPAWRRAGRAPATASEIASSRLVLPAPFGPASTTGAPLTAKSPAA